MRMANSNNSTNSTGLLLIGGGGHAISVLEALHESGALALYESGALVLHENGALAPQSNGCVAILDIPSKVGASLLGVPVIGTDDDLGALRGEYASAFISLSSIGEWQRRERLFTLASAHGYDVPNIIHPKAYLSSLSSYATGAGIFAGMGACVNAGCDIGMMCILNTGCVIEHECIVGAYAHIAPGATLCGAVRVGAGAHIGAGSVVIQGVRVGEGALIGAGSVVVRDIPDGVVAYGNPCRVIRPLITH